MHERLIGLRASVMFLKRDKKGQASFKNNVDHNNEHNAALQQRLTDKKRCDGLLACFVVVFVQNEIITKNVSNAVESFDAPAGLAGYIGAVGKRVHHGGIALRPA